MHEQDFQLQLLNFPELNNIYKENDNKENHHEFYAKRAKIIFQKSKKYIF